LLKKNFPRTAGNAIAFWWSMVGSFLQAVITMNKDNVRGVVRGISGIRDLSRRMADCRV
jgi:hypothetical protein